MWSEVESSFIAKSGHQEKYAEEHAPVVVVKNIYELGDLVAQRFEEWVKSNPTGVVALPTGRTPEFFIKTMDMRKEKLGKEFPDTSKLRFVMLDEFFPMLPTHKNSFCRYIRAYYTSVLEISEENTLTFDLVGAGIISEAEMSVFANIDVDLTLLNRDAANESEQALKEILLKAQSYCDFFEKKVADLGGIGFFLGGIGPDGHIAFNQPGSLHDSKTRLVNFNYPTAAAAAGDLGGIEVARGKAAMTIGLGTITCSSQATIIIMAAGEGKAPVVRSAVEDEISVERPASCLQRHAGARFYLTEGAASQLTGRKAEQISSVDPSLVIAWALRHLSSVTFPGGDSSAYAVIPPDYYSQVETLIYSISLRNKVPVHELQVRDMYSSPTLFVPDYLRNEFNCGVFVACASHRLREKIEAGLKATSPIRKSVLHTGPHHDDIMLSYHAVMHQMLGRNSSIKTPANSYLGLGSKSRNNSFDKLQVSANTLGEVYNENVNHFAYLTSGFHSVNSSFLEQKCDAVCATVEGKNVSFLEYAVMNGEITRDYDDIMTQFREAFLVRDFHGQDTVENIIFLRKIVEVWNIPVHQSYNALCLAIRQQVNWVMDEYLRKHNAGDSIPKEIQMLKGCMRETEVDRVWALSRMPMNRIHHLRSKFYTDDFFTPMPSLEDDAMPFANLLRTRQPDIVTVAFDPEGTGPDTHYKVLLVVAAGLRISRDRGDLLNDNPIVWGYRNVWFEFTPSSATLLVPVASTDLDLMHDTFMSCFTTQKMASFPSPQHDGPFSSWARELQQHQMVTMKTLLGEKYFKDHLDDSVRNCGGFVFLKAMYAEQFLKEVEELKSKFETKTI